MAVVDAYDDPTAESDLATFRSTSGLAACTTANGCFRKANQTGADSPLPAGDKGWEEEISLDLDAVSALCPNRHLLLVEASSTMSTDMTAAMQTAAALGARQISDSWSVSSSLPPGGTYTLPGVDIVAATGDHGYPGAGVDNYPAAFAGVTAAGGTSLSAASNGQGGRGFAESAWSLSNGWGGSSGCDLRLPKPMYQSDGGCAGRAYADVSADADPSTGLKIYDSGNGGWLLMGGTSLATPLIAAYYAITGVSAATPQWAYTSSALLNDPASGSSGSCAQNILYICNAGVGYDGPTGAGSISGTVVPGAPSIGGPSVGPGTNNTYTQSATSIDATLTGGIYPNGLQTTWWVEYGTGNGYGQHTSTSDVGSGQALVSLASTLTGLSPSTTYHYRFVAQNSDGTTYGPDSTLRTAAPGSSPPVNRAAPTISGDPRRGSPMMALPGSWSGTVKGYVYQWQRSSDGGITWSSISGATGATYAPVVEDEGARVRVYVSATSPGGTASAVSSGAGPVAAAPPINTGAPAVMGSAQVGATLTAAVGSWNPAAETFTYSWQRAYGSNGFQAIPGATRSSYTVSPNDLGDTIRVIVTATKPRRHRSRRQRAHGGHRPGTSGRGHLRSSERQPTPTGGAKESADVDVIALAFGQPERRRRQGDRQARRVRRGDGDPNGHPGDAMHAQLRGGRRTERAHLQDLRTRCGSGSARVRDRIQRRRVHHGLVRSVGRAHQILERGLRRDSLWSGHSACRCRPDAGRGSRHHARCCRCARRHRRTRAATRDSPLWLRTRHAGARLGVPHRRRTRWSSAAMQRRDHVARQWNAAPPQRRRRHGACGRSSGPRLRARQTRSAAGAPGYTGSVN
ncbi:MAG: hypothetical protein ACXVHX_07110 [Solirubrobacteraceae bacterium]